MNENQEPLWGQTPAPMGAHDREPVEKPADQAAPVFPESYSDPYAGSFSGSFGDTDEQHVFDAKRPKKRTGLFIGLGCLVLALLAAGGWWLLKNLPRRDPLKELKLAAEKSVDSYMDYIKDLPNLHKCVENLRAYVDSDAGYFDLSLSADESGETISMQIRSDRDAKSEKALMRGTIVAEKITIPFELYMDKEQLQIGSTFALDEGEAISLPMKDFGKKWNASYLAQASQVTLPESLSLSSLLEDSGEKGMEKTFDQDWTDFMDSVSYRKATDEYGADLFVGQGETYVLTWDQTLLEKMYNQANQMMNSMGADPQMDTVIPCVKIAFLKTLAEETQAPLFRIHDGMVTGVQLWMKSGLKETLIIQIEYLGEPTPWSRCVNTEFRWNPTTKTADPIETSDGTCMISNGQMRTQSTVTDHATGTTQKTSSVYNDADGSFTIQAEDPSSNFGALINSVSMRIVPTDGGVKMEAGMDLGTVSTGNAAGSFQFSLELGTKIGAIQPISDKPIQLLDLSEMGLGMLGMRIMQKLQGEGGILGGIN